MENKIQQYFLSCLFYRRDLIKIIQNVWISRFHKVKTLSFPFSTNDFKLFLIQYGLIEKELLNDAKSQPDENCIQKAIDQDNINELQAVIKEKDINKLFVPFETLDGKLKEIPLIHYTIIRNSLKCFKFLLINGNDPTEKINYS